MRLSTVIRAAAMIVCGSIFAILDACYLFPLWEVLAWRRPVADWIINFGLGDTIAGYWGLVWLRVPQWLLAAILGIISGLCDSKNWLVTSLCCGLAFVLTPGLFLFVIGQENPSAWFGPDVFISLQCWKVPSVVLVICLAFLSSRIRKRKVG